MLLLNLWNSNQGDMKRESFVSTIFIVFLQIEGNLLKKYQCTFLKRVPSIFRINIEIVLTKDYRFMSPWLLFRKFIFPSVMWNYVKDMCWTFGNSLDVFSIFKNPYFDSLDVSVALFLPNFRGEHWVLPPSQSGHFSTPAKKGLMLRFAFSS